MADKKPFYLTTTLPYVNAAPHIGFALEMVQADAIVRYQSLMGREVFFNTGTDEHGQKIFQKAQEEGKDTQAYVDEYAAKFRDLKEKLGLFEDIHFIRTTDTHHKAAAQELWRRCAAKGDIYKKKYKGLYCVGDEMFLKETDLVNGKCPNHPNLTPIEIEEENYFFKLSAYQDRVLAYLKDPAVVVPDWRREEAIKFAEAGLEDFSISREVSRMSWGVPVPGDDTQVMYVWFDALTNYISSLGWPEDKEGLFKKFWEDGETLQLAGKDQVRFQSIMWQAMLMSADLPATQHVFYHGFITSGGQKMSKSLGNVIDPLAIVEEYGIDALRYFLLRHIHPFDDSDFTTERFKDAYNADLANGLGNLVARVMQMATQYLDGPVELTQETQRDPLVSKYFEQFEINQALFAVWVRIGHDDAMITLEKPFSQIKSDDPKLREQAMSVIKHLVRELYVIASEIEPVMPNTSSKIKEAIESHKKPDNLFVRKD